MSAIMSLVVVAVLICSFSIIQGEETSSNASEIIDDDLSRVSIHQDEPDVFGFMVKIFHNKSVRDINMCSGTLISRRFVLTAAQCISQVKSVSVLLRKRRLAADLHSKDLIKTDKFVVHPDFNKNTMSEHNIGIIDLQRYVPLNTEYTRLIRLDSGSTKYKDEYGETLSWGATTLEGIIQPLKFISNRIQDQDECNKNLKTVTLTDEHVCLDGADKGLCASDDGTPLFTTDESVQLGVFLSLNRTCNNSTEPYVFVKVAKYFDWIKNNTDIRY